jgi:hypothetical protein
MAWNKRLVRLKAIKYTVKRPDFTSFAALANEEVCLIWRMRRLTSSKSRTRFSQNKSYIARAVLSFSSTRKYQSNSLLNIVSPKLSELNFLHRR